MVQIVNIPVVKQGADLDGTDQIEGQEQAGGAGSSFRTSIASLTEKLGEDITVGMDQVTGLVDDQTRQDDALADHETAPDPHPQYLTPQELPQTAVVYMSAATHPVYPTDRVMRQTVPTAAEAALVTSVGADDVLCEMFTRETPLDQDVLYAELESRVVLDLGGEDEATFVYVKVVLRKGDASPDIELGTSTPLLLEANRTTYVFSVQILGPVQAVAGDYTVVELYGTKDGGGATRTVTVYVDGNGVSRMITYLPIPAYPAEHGPSHSPGGTDEIPGLVSETAALQTFAFAAYGGMRMSTPTAFADLGAAWQTLDVFDALSVAAPRGMSFNTGTGEFIIDNDGVYTVSLSGSFIHNTQTGERFTYLRFWDVTAGAAVAAETLTSAGRDDGASPISIFGLAEIDAASAGHSFRVEIGNGDTFTDVTFQSIDLTLFNVGEWRAALP